MDPFGGFFKSRELHRTLKAAYTGEDYAFLASNLLVGPKMVGLQQVGSWSEEALILVNPCI